jgi:diphthamide biosynthesis protein 7
MKVECNEPFSMTLSVTGSLDSLITCNSQGQLRLSSVEESFLRVTSEWQGHDSEIWYVAADVHDQNLFYSCADEGALKAWDSRSLAAPVFVDKRTHEAGVCCAAGNLHEEFIFATGSYDEKVRIWDRRAMKQPQRTIDCGSGAWRVIWNPERQGELGVAVMRKGFFVYNESSEEPISGLSLSEEAVAYGLDLLGDTAVSCSFYNNEAQIWQK